MYVVRLCLFVCFLPGLVIFSCCNATALSKARRNCAGNFKRAICTYYLNQHDVHNNHGAMRHRNVDRNRFELEDTQPVRVTASYTYYYTDMPFNADKWSNASVNRQEVTI